MKLVVDTNILFSLFANEDSFKEFIKDNCLELYAPNKVFDELKKHSERICEVSGLEKINFDEIINELPKIIEFNDVSVELIEKAEKHINDPKDAPFLALAWKLNIPIWSEDAHFKKQSLVKTFTFDELKIFLAKDKKEEF